MHAAHEIYIYTLHCASAMCYLIADELTAYMHALFLNAQGVILVVAAGNSNSDACQSHPASVPRA